MTTENSTGNMPALETWVRQLSGALNVEEVVKKSEPPLPTEYIKEFYISLNVEDKCLWTLTNGKYSPKAKPNVRFVFNAKNRELVSVEILKGGFHD